MNIDRKIIAPLVFGLSLATAYICAIWTDQPIIKHVATWIIVARALIVTVLCAMGRIVSLKDQA